MGTDTKSDGKLANLIMIWVIAGLGGVLACVMLYNFSEMGITGAVVFAGLLAGLVGAFLTYAFSKPLTPPTGAGLAPAAQPAAVAAPKPAPAPVPEPEPAPEPELAPEPDPEPTPEPAPAPVAEAPAEADKPRGLDAARDGGADDLKQIKGVGPKLEELLHSMGYYHFDQIAAWTEREVAWVDENLEGFKGRVTRDEWVAQAKDLATG